MHNIDMRPISAGLLFITMQIMFKFIIYRSGIYGKFINFSSINSQLSEMEEKVRKIIGTNASEELFGTENNDAIIGKRGNDYLVGYGGNDYLDGGDGIDVLFPGGGNDTVIGGAGDDALFDNEGGNDLYYPGRGNDDTRDQIGVNIFVYEKELQGGFGNDYLDQGFAFDDKIIFKGYKSSDADISQNEYLTTFNFNDGSSLIVENAGTVWGVTLIEGRDYFFEKQGGPICGF